MYLIDVQAFIKRERSMSNGEEVDCGTKVMEFHGDEAPPYAILSHRWIKQEVDYKEMIKLAKMKRDERDEIRQRDGYQKILNSSEQAKKDKYDWLWIDTCCIDKRSSTELSEAINSMYRWYENSKVCYVYLHDVPGTSFPTERDDEKYPKSNGWPEWFSRGWTLQEMIAPHGVQFFNKDWQLIADKKILARTISDITRVPQHILTSGLSSNRPCVAQIMSWAADRNTTRVEDRAYSLLGLLDVNMPMLYGEGKKAFHRLQLEIIRMSDDQSIFAWGFDEDTRRNREPRRDRQTRRSGSILADSPSFFRDCAQMQLIDYDDFIRYVKDDFPGQQLPSIEEDRFGTFSITNRGINIWLPLCPLDDSNSVFEAWLPCRPGLSGPPVRITLALWNSNYYRFFTPAYPIQKTLKFCPVYLRYQDTPHRATFEVDDSAITGNGFTYYGTYPSKLTGNTLTITSNDPLCVKVYSNTQTHCLFAVGFGQCFGEDWVHCVYGKPTSEHSWENDSRFEYDKMLVRGPEHARSMAEVHSQGGRYGRVYVKHTCIPGSSWTVRTSCVTWESSRNCGVRIDAFQYPYNGPDTWMGFYVEGTNDSNYDIWGLMIPYSPRTYVFQSSYTLRVDGVTMKFSLAPKGVKLGDYGHLTDYEDFRYEGNVFADLTLEPNITARRHKIENEHGYNTDNDYVKAHRSDLLGVSVSLHKPLGLSLPNDLGFNSSLVSLSNRLTNKYLITRVVQCVPVPSSEWSSHDASPYRCESMYTQLFHTLVTGLYSTTPFCKIAKPFVWHRDEGAGSASVR
ncbi:hypothetical protein V8B97DRAFT_1871798 [Scleroderma yunnanense]